MRGVSGAATLRHVSFVALEALLIALLVWIAAMTLAGAGPSGAGLIGTAQAGRDPASVTVPTVSFGDTAVVTARPGDRGSWIHVECSRDDGVVLSEWIRLGASGRASVTFGPRPNWSAGGATCLAETGLFSAAGRWRVQAATAFRVEP